MSDCNGGKYRVDRLNYGLFFWIIYPFAMIYTAFMLLIMSLGWTWTPMAMRGDVLTDTRMMALYVSPFVGVLVFTLWLILKPLSGKTYMLSLACLIFLLTIPSWPRVNNEYHARLVTAERVYSIPWQYEPYAYQLPEGYKVFRLEVSPNNFMPRHEYDHSGTLEIGLATRLNSAFDFSADMSCRDESSTFQCETVRNGQVYWVEGQKDWYPRDRTDLMDRVVTLIDGFEVKEPSH